MRILIVTGFGGKKSVIHSMSNRFYHKNKNNNQWKVDVEEFDSEIEVINKKFIFLGSLSLVNLLINIYLLLKIYQSF